MTTLRSILLGLALGVGALAALALAPGASNADERSDAAKFCSRYKFETGVSCDSQKCPCGRTTKEIKRWDRRGLRLSMCACVSKSEQAAYERKQKEPQCTRAADCDDGVFCNGRESCSDGRCRAGGAPCSDTRCDERADRCEARCEDRDGDGHAAIHCGGDDCDDRDPKRFPGNVEVCDSRGIDEDCDPTTVGNLDRDGDGFVSFTCR